MKKLFLAGIALLAAPLSAQGGAPFVVVETGQGFARLQQAVDAVGDRDGTIRIAPGRHRDCAVQTAGRIAFVAAQPGTAVLDGAPCEGKAALVLRGRGARVEGLTFQNLRVPDGNGAGIRLEKGNLHVLETLFRNSEEGILSGDDLGSEIRIERSTFSGLGRCDRGLSCAHSLYIGNYGTLRVIRSRFEKGTGGHYVKTRTPKVEIVDSSFDDSGGRTTNYMIDLSNGGSGTIARNSFVQGRDKENYSALIMVAAEGVWHPSRLTITGNQASVAPGFDKQTSFVADASGDAIRIAGNKVGARIKEFERR
ncbi:MAG TPA: right-handed parallel beta-helix repeat-containing protein [Allosphingosinicella sp.]|uniref:right-handed parallel beta-helix repeat-containing protein n=1 Tax=Allosphingosinicella sp. TaxID=2823234 RepID=UPI002F2A096C